jgi:hypothetical protein
VSWLSKVWVGDGGPFGSCTCKHAGPLDVELYFINELGHATCTCCGKQRCLVDTLNYLIKKQRERDSEDQR